MLNPRQEEIDRYNSSIHIEGGKRVFSYFWKVLDFTETVFFLASKCLEISFIV
jgi:hypothetical protein